MLEFWEEAFKSKQEMWGFEPSFSALQTAELFVENNLEKILIPGIGYGRNVPPFTALGMEVTGIEISETAIELAKRHYGKFVKVYHGSVADMPFDTKHYDGIFCYALIHLLDSNERAKLIVDCYNQLAVSGYMVFTTITKDAQTYGQGTLVSKERYEQFGGVKIFFYDKQAIQNEFGKYGLFEITEVNENYPLYLIKCKKANPGI